MVELIILVTSVLVSASVGIFVYARNPKSIVNKVFGLLSLTLTLFPIANYFSLHSDQQLLFIRLVLFCTTVLLAALYYLVVLLGDDRTVFSKWQKAGIWYAVLVASLVMTPLVFKGLSGTGANVTPVPNVGAVLFFLHFVIFPAASFLLLIKRIKVAQGIERLQYFYLWLGIAPIFLLAPVTSFILPVVFKNSSLIVLSPLYSAFFVSLVGYAILKHRLFDVRFFVVRAMAYLMTTLLLSALYVAPALLLVMWLLDLRFHAGAFILGVAITSLAAFFYEKARVWFDGVTSRVFFRQAYNPEQFIAELNRAVVAKLDLDTLLTDASKVIAANFKAEYCVIGIKEGPTTGQRTFGEQKQAFNKPDIAMVRAITPHMHLKVIVADYLPPEYEKLRRIMQQNNVAVLARLATEVESEEEGLGYIILGAKKSGQQYNTQDVRTLETIIDGLIVAIQNAMRFEEIQQFNVTLQRKIEEATRQLRRSNAKLQALDETKDDFISMASHQLRTPLTTIKGYISMVLDGDAGPLSPMQHKMLDQAFLSSQRMVFLIADLLNISRLKTGKFVIEPAKVNLAKIVEDEVRQLKETAAGRSLALSYEKPAGFPDLMLDETKIRQVIMNFIDNAIYYTPAGGKIAVSLVEKPATVELRVADTGIGVPKSEQPHLFTKFYRAGNARRARPDGTGLGLFMAKKVIVAQGGLVIFDSKEGKGSTFGFVFSKSKVAIKPKPQKVTVT